MPTVGEQMRSARERARMTVHDLANALNMKADQVRAVEESRWAEFGAPVYIRGFVRTMSHHLKLDTVQLVAELEEELKLTEGFADAPSLLPRRKGPLDFIMLQLSRIRWTLVLPLLLGIAVVGAVLYGLRHTNKTATAARNQPIGSGLYLGRHAAGQLMLPLPTNAPPNVAPRQPGR